MKPSEGARPGRTWISRRHINGLEPHSVWPSATAAPGSPGR